MDYISLSARFALGNDTLPTFVSQTSFSLRFDQASFAILSFPKVWKGSSAANTGASNLDSVALEAAEIPTSTTSSSIEEPQLGRPTPTATSPVDTHSPAHWTPSRNVPTPDRLRVRLKCKKRSAGGMCSVMVRLLVQFEKSTLSTSVDDVEKSSKKMQEDLKFKCSVRSWKDTAGLLGVSVPAKA